MREDERQNLLSDFQQRATRIGVTLTAPQLAGLEEFCLLIASFSEHTNIVGNSNFAVLLQEHVLDSLTLLPVISQYRKDQNPLSVIDIGSGAGFRAWS